MIFLRTIRTYILYTLFSARRFLYICEEALNFLHCISLPHCIHCSCSSCFRLNASHICVLFAAWCSNFFYMFITFFSLARSLQFSFSFSNLFIVLVSYAQVLVKARIFSKKKSFCKEQYAPHLCIYRSVCVCAIHFHPWKMCTAL